MLEVDGFNACNINPLLRSLIKFSFRNEVFFWTVTRGCAFNRQSHMSDKFASCQKECLKQKVVIRNKEAGKLFLLKGNSIVDLEPPPDKPAASIILQRIVRAYK